MSLTTNTALYNFQSDLTVLGCIGQNLSTNKIGMYFVSIPVHDPITNYPKERLFGRKNDRTNVFARNGKLAGVTLQNVQINEYMGTLTLADNEVFEVDKSIVEGYRNVVEALALGEKFSDGTDIIQPLGIGGNVILSNGTVLRGKDWKYFFERDAKCVEPYTGQLIDNVFLGAYNKTSLTTMLELKMASAADTDQVLKYTAVCCGNTNGSEAEEKNISAVDVDFISDFRTYNNLMREGFNALDVDLPTALPINRLKVNYIIAQAGGADPTDWGTAGDTAMIINSTDGTFTIKTSDGSSSWTAVAGTIADGAVIFSDKFGIATTVDGATPAFKYVAVKTGGAAGTGTAVGTTVTSPTTYTMGTTYDLPVYSFKFSDSTFGAVTAITDIE